MIILWDVVSLKKQRSVWGDLGPRMSIPTGMWARKPSRQWMRPVGGGKKSMLRWMILGVGI